jgi:F0F1-type ATP synthase alpha subunit
MRGFAMDFMSTQIRDYGTHVIYAITHDKEAAMAELRSRDNLLHKVTVVSVRDVEQDPVTRAAEAVAVSATACSIAESLAHDSGQDALVIVDTIDDYKVLWDATTRVLVNVFGVDAVVKEDVNGAASSEMRAYYSALIQRVGQFKTLKGGGSVTLLLLTTIPKEGLEDLVVFDVGDFDGYGDKIKARLDILLKKNIPLTAVNLRKIDIPIPSEGHRRLVLQHVDDLMSMSDGQVWLDDSLAKMGQSPPMDPKKSLTRVGIGADTASRADAPAIRRMVEGLRLDLVQAASMEGAETTVASAKQIRKRNAWLLAMHQKPGQGGRTLSESCVALLAASIGALNDTIDSGGLAGTPKGESVMRDLLLHVKTVAPDAVAEIDETQDIGVDRRKELVKAVESFFS